MVSNWQGVSTTHIANHPSNMMVTFLSNQQELLSNTINTSKGNVQITLTTQSRFEELPEMMNFHSVVCFTIIHSTDSMSFINALRTERGRTMGTTTFKPANQSIAQTQEAFIRRSPINFSQTCFSSICWHVLCRQLSQVADGKLLAWLNGSQCYESNPFTQHPPVLNR